MLSKNQLGFLYMFMSICAFSLMDVIVKWSVDYPIGQVLFFRGFFGIIFYFFVIPRERLHNFYETKRPGLHLLRCTSGQMCILIDVNLVFWFHKNYAVSPLELQKNKK